MKSSSADVLEESITEAFSAFRKDMVDVLVGDWRLLQDTLLLDKGSDTLGIRVMAAFGHYALAQGFQVRDPNVVKAMVGYVQNSLLDEAIYGHRHRVGKAYLDVREKLLILAQHDPKREWELKRLDMHLCPQEYYGQGTYQEIH